MGVQVEADARALRVRFTGWDALWTVSPGIEVPAAQVTAVSVMRVRDARRDRQLRLPGVYLPRVVQAGSYRGPDGSWELWCWHGAEHVLVASVSGNRYRRIVVQVDDPTATSRAVRLALTGVGGT